MDQWEQTLSVPVLLLIAAGAIAVLLVAIIRFKIHPLLALVSVSLLTAFATLIPPGEILGVLTGAFGSTLGEVALLVGLGAMFGRLAEVSGGAKSLSESLVKRFGAKRAPFALGVTSLLFGFPIFFDAAFMVMLPIIFSIARKLGGGVLIYALPAAAALSTMHIFLPPHPGAVASTVLLGGDMGLVILLGIVVAVPTWYVAGYLYGMFIGKRIILPVPDFLSGGPEADPDQVPPKPRVIVGLLLLPLVLILGNSIAAAMVKSGSLDENSPWATLPGIFGSTPVALLITVFAAIIFLGIRRGTKAGIINDLVENSLKPVAPVILITGAGGMFGGVLLASGIGSALAGVLGGIGLPIIVSTFVIAAILRIALGTATVAITTSAGLLSASVVAAGLNPIETTAVVLSLAAGSAIFPHVNDASFWMIGRILNMDVPTTFKTWSVIKTLISLVGFALACVLFVVGSMLG